MNSEVLSCLWSQHDFYRCGFKGCNLLLNLQFTYISAIEHPKNPCPKLPFEATPKNNLEMNGWLIQRYAASTFNECPHQQLPSMTGPHSMTGPQIRRLRVDPDAKPTVVHTPMPVPL